MSPTQTDVIAGSDTPAWPRSTSPQKETELRRSWSARSGERSAEQPDPAAGLGHPSGEDSAPIRVLVVDDEPDVQRLFQMRFRKDIRAGEFELQFAADGRQAMAAIEADPNLDVVVTDLNMPVMDGLALLAVIDEMDLPLKTIVLSAYGDTQTVRMAMMRGAFDFQVKPLDVDELRSTINKAVIGEPP
jgi:adenylate cyclase